MRKISSTKSGRAFGLVLAAGASAAILGGCGATTESVVDKMFDEKIESAASEMEYEIGIKLESDGMSMEFGVEGDGEMEFAKDGDDMIYHGLFDAKLNVPEMVASFLDDDNVSAEIYGETTDDETTVYLSTDDGDSWNMTTQEVENSLDEDTQEEIVKAYKKVLYDAELQKKLEDVNGEKCYVLKLETTGDKFSEVYDIVFDAVEEESGESIDDLLDDADLSRDDLYDLLEYVKIDITMYASKKTGQCVRCDVDASETELGALIAEAAKLSGEDLDNLPIDLEDIKFTACSFSITSKDINDTEVEIPKKVKENAEETGFGGRSGMAVPVDPDVEPDVDPDVDPDVTTGGVGDKSSYKGANADGSFTFPYNDGNDFVVVSPVDPYELDEGMSDGYSAYFYDDNWNYYYVSDSCDYAVERYITEGIEPDSSSYQDFVCNYDVVDGLTVNGNPVFVVDASYTYVWSDGDTSEDTYKAILIAYHDDSWDEDTFCQIPLDNVEDADQLTLDDMAKIAGYILANN